jgi:hypothetical protein
MPMPARRHAPSNQPALTLWSADDDTLGARYALLLSIETPVEGVDLWTPVAQQVGLPIAIET